MMSAFFAAALMPVAATLPSKEAPFCRGVLLKDEQGTFVLISLKIAGNDLSRAKVRKAAEGLKAYHFTETKEGRTILSVGFTSNVPGEKVVRFWEDIRTGVYGAVTVEPFALPGSWIEADHPCFGASVGR